MTAQTTMADVLREHWTYSDVWPPRCFTCGDIQERTDADHKAAALSAAGFGPVVVHVHHHDIEAHATSFNEGYNAAVTQGLADDPSLADDWFQEKLREARAAALELAADDLARLPYVRPGHPLRPEYERVLAVRRGNADAWLRARAASERRGL